MNNIIWILWNHALYNTQFKVASVQTSWYWNSLCIFEVKGGISTSNINNAKINPYKMKLVFQLQRYDLTTKRFSWRLFIVSNTKRRSFDFCEEIKALLVSITVRTKIQFINLYYNLILCEIAHICMRSHICVWTCMHTCSAVFRNWLTKTN